MRRLVLSALIGSVLAACAPPNGEPAPGGSPADPRAASPGRIPDSWFYRQRLTGDGQVPVRARSRALAAARETGGLADASGDWQSVGPVNVGGRVTAIAVDPNDPQRVWVGAAAGGVFLTTDGGASFVPVFDEQVALSIGALAAHPSDSNTLYVGTGEDNGGGFSYDGEGVFKTVDGGQTWTSMGLAEVRRIGKMAVDPTDGDRIFVAAGGDWYNKDTDRGIYRSTDGGQTWDQVLYVADDAGGIDVSIDPTDTDRVYASIWQRQSLGTTWYIGGTESGIYRSLDGGDTWTKLTNGLPAAAGRIGLSAAPSRAGAVWANVVAVNGASVGIYQSVDGGDSWTLRNTPGFSSFSYYFSQIRVDPSNFKRVYALDQQLWLSTDNAASFSPVATSVHVDWHDLVLEASGRMLAGTDGGFYTSDDGLNWTHATTLPITQFYDLALDRQDANRRFGGAQDNGTVRTTSGGAGAWSEVLGGDGLQCEVDYVDPLMVYASAQFGNIFRSVNGGSSFSSATSGISGPFNWNAPVTLDPQVPTTLYTGTNTVYRSTDAAVSWTSVSPVLTGALSESHQHEADPGANHLQNLIRHTITVIRPSPADPDVIWAGTDDGNVWVTDDGGSVWNPVSPPGLSYWVTDVAPDPFDAQSAYLAVTGYRQGDKLPYVRWTRDLGQTWEDVSGNLPQVPVNRVLADSVWRGRIYAGTDLGVYLSDVGGSVWSVMHSGMPWVVVMDLVRHEQTDTLFAGTHGRSIYSFDLLQLGEADGDGDGSNNNEDCALADPGAFAPPGEVDSLGVDRGVGPEAVLGWSSLAATAGTGTLYDVATGAIAELAASGTTQAASLSCGVAGTTLTDAGPLAPGAGRYYLVRGRNVCGLGVWGAASGGSLGNPPVCP